MKKTIKIIYQKMEDTNPLKSFNYKGIYFIQSNAIKLGLRLTGGAR